MSEKEKSKPKVILHLFLNPVHNRLPQFGYPWLEWDYEYQVPRSVSGKTDILIECCRSENVEYNFATLTPVLIPVEYEKLVTYELHEV